MNALSSFIGAAPEGGREQTVWTPPSILDAVDLVFADGWGDVFPSIGSPATRRAHYVNTMYGDAYFDHWYIRNFANPPYDDLRRALSTARLWWHADSAQSIQLVPIRTRRQWWCENVAGASVAYLRPITFIDPKTGKPWVCINKKTGKATVSQFPENLAAIYWGDRKKRFADAFAPLSHHVQESF